MSASDLSSPPSRYHFSRVFSLKSSLRCDLLSYSRGSSSREYDKPMVQSANLLPQSHYCSPSYCSKKQIYDEHHEREGHLPFSHWRLSSGLDRSLVTLG